MVSVKLFIISFAISICLIFPNGPDLTPAIGQSQKQVDSTAYISPIINPKEIPEKTLTADSIMGSRVINLEGVTLGTVVDILVDSEDGRVIGILINFGGFMGVGGEILPLSWNSLALSPEGDSFYLDLDKKILSNAPAPDMDRFKGIPEQKQENVAKNFYAPGYEGKGYGYREYGYGYVKQTGTEQVDTFQNVFDPGSMEKISGEIMRVERAIPQAGLVPQVQIKLTVFAETGEIMEAFLGPQWFIVEPDRKYPFKAGDMVNITGSRITPQDGPTFIIATEVVKGGELLRLRTGNGDPLWMGWEKN